MLNLKWSNKTAASPQIRRQLDHLATSLYENEDEELIGLYLHGSLAMGCFQSRHSDLDLLVLVRQPPTAERLRSWAEFLLQLSLQPAPIEISFLHRDCYTPWQHPTPFAFHFSEDWRATISHDVQEGAWRSWDWSATLDPDLAGHFTVTRRRGVCLAGEPIATAVPAVPWADYLDSIQRDLFWSYTRASDNPLYLVLNACRVWAAAAEQLVLSKAEGAVWAQPRLPAPAAATVAAAAAVYAGRKPGAGRKVQSTDAMLVTRWIGGQLGLAL